MMGHASLYRCSYRYSPGLFAAPKSLFDSLELMVKNDGQEGVPVEFCYAP